MRPVADEIDRDRVVEGTEGYAASDIELLAETRSSLRDRDDGDRDAGSDPLLFG